MRISEVLQARLRWHALPALLWETRIDLTARCPRIETGEQCGPITTTHHGQGERLLVRLNFDCSKMLSVDVTSAV